MRRIILFLTILLTVPLGLRAQGTSWQTATKLSNGSTGTGTLSGSQQNAWFKVEVPEEGTVKLNLSCGGSLSLYRFVFAFVKDNDWYTRGDKYYPEQSSEMELTDVGKGTYYIYLIRSGGEGTFSVQYQFTACPYANDEEPNDKFGQGVTIINGQTLEGRMGYRDATDYLDDTDWYKIEVPQDGRVQMALNCDQEYGLHLYRYVIAWYDTERQDWYTRADKYYPASTDTVTIDNAGPGTYYVLLHRSTGHGGYKLKYIFTPNSYRNDEEPNDARGQAVQSIDIDESVTGHLGYRDANNKEDNSDWFKLETDNAAAIIKVNIQPDTTSTLSFYYVSIVGVKNGAERVYTSKYYVTSAELMVTDFDQDATYYVNLVRSQGHGGYSVTNGSLQRIEGSEIRISQTGRGTTRLGIDSPMDVKVENVGAGHTGSFFIAIPATPDIEFVSATLPTENGPVEYPASEFTVSGGEEGDCAVFIMPDLGPFQSYTFTLVTKGRVGSNSRSDVKANFSLPDKAKAWLGALKSSTKKVVDNLETRAILEDGVSVATVDACIDAFIFTEKDRQQMAQAIGEVPHEYRSSYREPVAHPVLHYTTKVVQKINPIMAVPNALRASGQIANSLVTALRRKIWLWIYKDLGYVQDDPQVMDGKQAVDGVVTSWDPNEMVGPLGYGNQHFIGETRTMDYRILFENKAEATAPAYRIRISDVLDENVFDVSTVRFGATSHEGTEYNWKMSREGNKLSWDIEGIELPPNVNAPEGEGYVTFSVDLKPGLKNIQQIGNRATIIFDYNEPIETNRFINILDLRAPITKTQSVTMDGSKATITALAWESESGVSYYRFYASVNGGDFGYLGQSKEPSFTFTADQNATYTVYAVAVDNVGNAETVPTDSYTFSPSGIMNINALPSGRWTVTTLGGTVVADGQGVATTQGLPAGVYIVRQGNSTRKVIIK